MQTVTHPSPCRSPHARRLLHASLPPSDTIYAFEEGAPHVPGDILQLPLSTSKSLTEA
jgi:hypothetical protein